MCSRTNRPAWRSRLEASNIAYWTIRFMHDNPILPLIRNPRKLLRAAGVEQGLKVLEVGCGPGFFTIPAAEIVGDSGHVYAIDIHPRAVERVKQKIANRGINHVTVLGANASDTGLPNGSIDIAFVFGLRHVAGGFGNMISGLHRVLTPRGILSFEKTSGSQTALIEGVERNGFSYTGKNGRIFLFTKKEV